MHVLLVERPDKIVKTRDIEVVERGDDTGLITINTPAIDRDQDRVYSAGARLENYAKNPVVQYGHNYRDPWATVGRTLRMEQSEQHLKARFKLRPAANEYDPQNIVLLLWRGDWIRTASIGFAPVWAKTDENEHGGLDFREWDLLEWSLVPVPANQEALRLAVKGLGDAVELVSHAADALRGQRPVTEQLRQLEPQLLVVNHILGTSKLYTPANTTNDQLTMTASATWDGARWVRFEEFGGVLREVTQHKTVIPYRRHPLAPQDAPWDGPAQMRASEIDDLRIICTWYDGDNPDVKGSYKLPHHLAAGEHSTVWRGVAAAMGALLGARGGVNIPADDKRGVYNHLARHYRDFDQEPPEFRAYTEQELKELFPDELFTGPAGPDKQDTEPAPAQPDGSGHSPAPVQGDNAANQDALPSDEPSTGNIEPDNTEPAPGSTADETELTPEQESQVADALLELIGALRQELEV